jgi:hypothetical protein
VGSRLVHRAGFVVGSILEWPTLPPAEAIPATLRSIAEKATEHARAWDLVEQVAAQADLKRTLAQAEAAAAEEEELVPLREEHARHASKLRLQLQARWLKRLTSPSRRPEPAAGRRRNRAA